MGEHIARGKRKLFWPQFQNLCKKVEGHSYILALGIVFQLSRVVFQVIAGACVEVRELAANLPLGVNKTRRVFCCPPLPPHLRPQGIVVKGGL